MNYNAIKTGVLILLSGALMAACTAQPAPEDPNSVNGMVLRATMPDGVTKTTLSEDYQVLWQTGDKVSVNGTLSNAVASADNGKKAVEFTIDGTLNAPYKVLYPGTTSSNVISLPATQNYVAGSFDPAAAASFGNARKSGDAFIASLTHFCGILRFALKGSATLSKIEINALGGEKLYGNFTLATDSDGFTGSWTGGTAGKLTYSFGSGLTLSGTDTPIYVAIPAQAYASGIEALVYQQDGAYMRLKFWGSGNSLGANDLIEFESKTFAAGRTENLFSIADLQAEAGGEPTAESPGITVAVYNVLVEESRSKPYSHISIAEVRTALGTAIAKTQADIIGFNELDDDNFESGGSYPLQTIAENQGFTGYTWKLNNPDDIHEHYLGLSYNTYNRFADGFAYKTNLFEVSDYNYVWLSHVADNTYYNSRSDAYGNSGGPETTCVYAKFKHKVSNKQFYFFVTHTPTLDHTGSEVDAPQNDKGEYDKEDPAIAARRLRVLNNLKYFASQKAGNLPYIIVGDFNFGPYIDTKKTKVQPLYTAMTDGGFVNAYDQVMAADNLAGIYVNYPGTQTGSLWNYDNYLDAAKYPQFRIDHIYLHNGTSQGLTAESYKTIRETYDYTYTRTVTNEDNEEVTESISGTWCPSDHFPVVSYITFD